MVIKGLKVGVTVGASVGVWEGVGVYFETLNPGSGKGKTSSADLAQPDRQRSNTANITKKTSRCRKGLVLFNPVILIHLFKYQKRYREPASQPDRLFINWNDSKFFA